MFKIGTKNNCIRKMNAFKLKLMGQRDAVRGYIQNELSACSNCNKKVIVFV